MAWIVSPWRSPLYQGASLTAFIVVASYAAVVFVDAAFFDVVVVVDVVIDAAAAAVVVDVVKYKLDFPYVELEKQILAEVTDYLWLIQTPTTGLDVRFVLIVLLFQDKK